MVPQIEILEMVIQNNAVKSLVVTGTQSNTFAYGHKKLHEI